MKKVFLNFVFLFAALSCFSQNELYILNDSPDRLYVIINLHELPVTGCEVDGTAPAICLLPGGETMFPFPLSHTIHSVRVFNANAGCVPTAVDWTIDGHLIFPPLPCAPSSDFDPYTLSLFPCGINCQKLLIN